MASEGDVKRAMERQNAAASSPAPHESVSANQSTQSSAGVKKPAKKHHNRDKVKKPFEYDRTLILNHAYMR